MIQSSLVLEGGAMRGVFTSGALDFLMKKKVEFSHVIGVSAGACNASGYLANQIGHSRECWIHENDNNSFYYNLPQMINNKSLLDMDMIFERYPNEIYPFDYKTFFGSAINCELVVTNCETGCAEYKTENRDKKRLMDICRASCSMPLVTPMVQIDGMNYLDGGIADSIPIKRALEYGNDKIVLILTRRKGYRKSYPRKAAVRLYQRRYKKYPCLVKALITRPLVYNKTIAEVERLEDEGKIFVLRPEIPTIKRLEKDYEVLMNFYQHGYSLMEREFEKLRQFLEE